jgi:hypothetical protein
MVSQVRRHGTRARIPSRFGYRARWWHSQATRGADPYTGYWSLTRRPLPSLFFVLPILLAYEAGVIWIGGASADALRTGADAWLRSALAGVGFTDRWLVPVGLVVGLVSWQAVEPRAWRVSAPTMLGMALESGAWAIALVGVSRLLDWGFLHLEGHVALAAGTPPQNPTEAVVSFLGAGVYEEGLFRLALIPALYGLLRLLQAPRVLASTVAVTGSALLFSIAHHAGAPGEPFTWYAFIFRWLAGVFFAWVFMARGFGIAVGTHTAYDVLVGWLGLHL